MGGGNGEVCECSGKSATYLEEAMQHARTVSEAMLSRLSESQNIGLEVDAVWIGHRAQKQMLSHPCQETLE